MQKKNASLVSFILLIIFTILAFIPITLKITAWDQYYPGAYIERGSDLLSLAGSADLGSFTGILVCICLLSAFVGIIALIFQYIGKCSKRIDLLTYAPIVSGLTFILFCMFNILPTEMPHSYSPTGYIGCTPAWGFYISVALILSVSVMSFLIATGRLKNIPLQTNPTQSTIDGATEILKYKKLLDEGVITQEEFDLKKKQLLGS